MSDRSASVTARLAKKLVTPIAAATATYAAKKVPDLIRERVVPRLKELSAAQDRSPAGQTERIPAARSTVSAKQREEQRRQRAEHRRERRERASTT